MSELLHNHEFYYAIAFLLFWVCLGVFGRKPLLAWMDGEISKISAELESARKLRAEAEAALDECKAKQAKAEREAKHIVDMARREVEDLRARSDADLVAYVEHQQRMASERIRRAESEAVDLVRNTAIDLGMSMARKMLSEGVAEADMNSLVDSAISDVSTMKLVREG